MEVDKGQRAAWRKSGSGSWFGLAVLLSGLIVGGRGASADGERIVPQRPEYKENDGSVAFRYVGDVMIGGAYAHLEADIPVRRYIRDLNQMEADLFRLAKTNATSADGPIRRMQMRQLHLAIGRLINIADMAVPLNQKVEPILDWQETYLAHRNKNSSSSRGLATKSRTTRSAVVAGIGGFAASTFLGKRALAEHSSFFPQPPVVRSSFQVCTRCRSSRV